MKKVIVSLLMGLSIPGSYALDFTYQQLVSCLLKDNVCLTYKPTQGPIIDNGAMPWFYPENGKDYGEVTVGTTRTLSFLVANVGTGPLTVYGFDKGSLADANMANKLAAVKYTPSAFQLTHSDCPLNEPFVLGVNATCSLRVKYIPSKTEKVGDVLKMLHSSAAVPAVVQDIYGEGIPPIPNQNPGSGEPSVGGAVDSNEEPNQDVTPEMAKQALSLSATELQFGELPKDSISPVLSVVLTNILDESLAFSSKRISNGFFKFIDNCDVSLPAKGSCTLQFTMDTSKIIKPSSNDTFTVQFKEGASATVSLKGKVMGSEIVASPNPAEVVAYGLNTESSVPLVLSNIGTSSASVSNLSISDTAEVATSTFSGFNSNDTQFVRIKSHNCSQIQPTQNCVVDIAIQSPTEVDVVKYLKYESNGKKQSIKINAKVAEADIAFSPSVVDWGVVPFYSNIEKELTLTNVGGKAIQGISLALPPFYSIASTTCGKSLEASDTCKYSLKFSPPETLTANTVKNATILNNGDIARIPFQVKGAGKGPVVYASTSEIVFGKVNPAVGYPSKSITLTNAGTESATIQNISLANTDFTLTPGTCGASLRPAESCVINVKLNTATNGKSTSVLKVESTSLKAPILDIDVKAEINGAILTATPSSIDFGDVAYGSSQIKTSLIKNEGNMPVKILQTYATGLRMGVTTTCTADKELKPNDTCTVEFNMSTGADSRDGAGGSISIITDAAKTATSVSAKGIGKGSYITVPDSAIAPLTKVGQHSYAKAVLTNWAYQPFTISDVSLSTTSPYASQWSEATHNCVNVAYQQSCVIQIKFTPTSYGFKPSTVHFISNDARYLNGSIQLKGDGMDGDIAFYVDGTLTKEFDFGKVIFKDQVSKTITMVNVGVQTTKVLQSTSNQGGWKTIGCVNETLVPGASCNFNVDATVPFIGGPEVQRSATFTFNYDKALSAAFTARYRSVGSWPTLSTTSITFTGNTPYNVSKSQKITISNIGSRPLEITDWIVDNDPYSEVRVDNSTCKEIPALTGTCELTVHYTSKKEGPLSAKIIANTNSLSTSYSSVGGELAIQVKGTSTAAIPQLSMNMVGTAVPKLRTLYLYNGGSSGLTIQALALNMTQGSARLVNGYSNCPALSSRAYCALTVEVQGANLVGSLDLRITGAAGSDGNGTFSLPLEANPVVYPITDNESFDFPGAHPTTSMWYDSVSGHGRDLFDGNYNTFRVSAFPSDGYNPVMQFAAMYGQSINKATAYVANLTARPLEFGIFDLSNDWSYTDNKKYVLLGKTTIPANFKGYIEVNFTEFKALSAPPTAWPYFNQYWGVNVFEVGNISRPVYTPIYELRVGKTPQ